MPSSTRPRECGLLAAARSFCKRMVPAPPSWIPPVPLQHSGLLWQIQKLRLREVQCFGLNVIE